jgi:hypothetical protein
MKLITAVVLLACSTLTRAEDRLVRVFAPGIEAPVSTGGTIPSDKVFTLLFLKEPCPLPIDGAERMFRAWQTAGAYQFGCWYPTLQDEFVYINGMGRLFHNEGVYWQAYPRGLLHSDGSVKITEPNYDSRTFFIDVTQRITMEHIQAIFQKQAP